MPAQYPGVPRGGCRMLVHGVGKHEFKPTFRSRNFSIQTFSVSGITKDSTGVALGGCTVKLFDTELDLFLKTTISDSGGNYSFQTTPGKSFYVVAYKAGSPDVAGTTVNALVGA